MTASVRLITARLRSRCMCGHWVRPGEQIAWSPDSRRTMGCPACGEHGVPLMDCPDPEAHPGALWASADDYPIFHSEW